MPNKPDRIPALDPTAPDVYRRIIDTAQALRTVERAGAQVQYSTLAMLRRIRAQAAIEVADRALEEEEQKRALRISKAKQAYKHRVTR
jgi:hypothetical protein